MVGTILINAFAVLSERKCWPWFLGTTLNHDVKFARAYTLCREMASWMASWMAGLGTGAFCETYSYISGIFETLKSGHSFGNYSSKA